MVFEDARLDIAAKLDTIKSESAEIAVVAADIAGIIAEKAGIQTIS